MSTYAPPLLDRSHVPWIPVMSVSAPNVQSRAEGQARGAETASLHIETARPCLGRMLLSLKRWNSGS